jgi:predicted HTH domain antitoxin
MTALAIQVPTDMFEILRLSPAELEREMRLASAIHWYQQAEISQEQAAAFAGMHRIDFLNELARRHIDVFQVDFEDLDHELRR